MEFRPISKNKSQISPSVRNDTIKAIVALSEAQGRSFSEMVNILLASAVDSLKSPQNGLKNEN